VRAAAAGPRVLRFVEIRGGDRVLQRFAGGGPQMEMELTLGPFEEDTAVWLTGVDEDGERFWTTPVRILVPGG